MLVNQEGIVPNAKRLLIAGFMAILAAGVGAAVRGGIFANWGADFGFTATQLGKIGGAGFTGFCFGIIIGGVLVDKWGYGKVVAVAFVAHILSAIITFMATAGMAQDLAYKFLFWGMFIFAYANGTLEGVANPLVATLFPKNRTHYLNILHASWPAGLVLGGFIGSTMGDVMHLSWKIQLAMYLLPVALYGFLFFGQTFPKSEASKKGVKIGGMFKDVGILGGLIICGLIAFFFKDLFGNLIPNPTIASALAYGIGGALLLVVAFITEFSLGSILLFVLFIVHGLIGAVELGTDGWIQNITGNILTPAQGKILFIWTSAIMFSLRFCAHWIEKNLKLSPVGLLMICATIACIGLNLTSHINTFPLAMIALAVYALGKTFFWPTMLAVASDNFPRTGAIAISIMGGIGMMSAGLVGSAGLGYAKDRLASEALNTANPAAYAEFKAEKPSKFLIFESVNGLDGTKLATAQKAVADYKADQDKIAKGEKVEKPAAEPTTTQKAVAEASITGDRKTLVADSAIPATMAVIYVCLFLYFKSKGGYKVVHIDAPAEETGH